MHCKNNKIIKKATNTINTNLYKKSPLVFRKIDLPKNYLSIRQKEIYSKSLNINHTKSQNLSQLLKDFI